MFVRALVLIIAALAFAWNVPAPARCGMTDQTPGMMASMAHGHDPGSTKHQRHVAPDCARVCGALVTGVNSPTYSVAVARVAYEVLAEESADRTTEPLMPPPRA